MVNIKLSLFILSLCSLLALIIIPKLHLRSDIPFAGYSIIIFLHADDTIVRMLLLKVLLHVFAVFRPKSQLLELLTTCLGIAYRFQRFNKVTGRSVSLASFRIFAQIAYQGFDASMLCLNALAVCPAVSPCLFNSITVYATINQQMMMHSALAANLGNVDVF